MFEAFSRSWEITKLSLDVIRKDKELLLFPLLAGIFSAIFFIAMLFPTILSSLLFGDSQALSTFGSVFDFIIVFLTYFGLAFIAVFFNVCVVYTTKKRFEGGNATFIESLKFAFSKIHLVFLWSLVSATVGLILRLIDNAAEKSGNIGKLLLRITTSILGTVWSIVTIFVIPGLVYHNLGPLAAIKKSIEVLKKTWGESLIRYYGTGLVQFAFIILWFLLTLILIIVGIPLGGIALVIVISLSAISFIFIIIFFNLINSIFNTALYVYADTGKIPSGYSKNVMSNAFARKK